jgi:WD repeat and SOF domain-containing protein 1
MFATASTTVDVWDHNRTSPVQTFEWGCETIKAVAFNPSETSILASCGSDRSIALWDMRSGKGLGKATLSVSVLGLFILCNLLIANMTH